MDKLLRILELCVLNSEKGNDCFFNYCPDVNYINLEFYEGEYEEGKLHTEYCASRCGSALTVSYDYIIRILENKLKENELN